MREVQGYPLPLGVQISYNKINFSIAVPTEKKCQLLIYRAGRKRLYRQFEMETAVGEVRCIALTDIEPAEYEYNYLIDGEVVVDPYVQALAGREHWGVKKETPDMKSEAVFCHRSMTGRETTLYRSLIIR